MKLEKKNEPKDTRKAYKTRQVEKVVLKSNVKTLRTEKLRCKLAARDEKKKEKQKTGTRQQEGKQKQKQKQSQTKNVIAQ